MVTCSSCGAEVPADARFCPRCGNTVSQPFQNRDWREMRYESKPARRAHKGWWWSPEWGLLNAVLAGLLVTYSGAVIYLASAGLIPVVTRTNVWAWLLIGLGAYLTVRSAARYFMAGRWGWFGGIIAGLILLLIGFTALAVSLTG